MPIGLPSNTPPSCVKRSLTRLSLGQECGWGCTGNRRLMNQEESNGLTIHPSAVLRLEDMEGISGSGDVFDILF